MRSLETQENLIYNQVQDLFFTHGYEPGKPGIHFSKDSEANQKSILFSVCNSNRQQVLDIHLAIEFKLISSLVCQFICDTEMAPIKYTIFATPHLFRRPPLQRFILTDEESLQYACKQIKEFMQKKGFRFLNTFDKLKTADAVINRKPCQHVPYVQDQVYRCFVGITIARLLQRTDFDILGVAYNHYLYSRKLPEKVTENFQKLLKFLKYYSLN